MKLDATSLRVLGALMEKEMTTPDLYPLSVNALLAASNQRSSRDPVMDLDEADVRGALGVLEANGLVAQARDGERGGRVARFEHRIRTVLNLRRDETAILCLLLLRGAQTPGELRSRSERMFSFDDLGSVQTALDRLGAREEPVVAPQARAPGAREIRFTHLLGDALAPARLAEASPAASPAEDNVAELQNTIAELRTAIEQLTARVSALELRSAPADGSH